MPPERGPRPPSPPPPPPPPPPSIPFPPAGPPVREGLRAAAVLGSARHPPTQSVPPALGQLRPRYRTIALVSSPLRCVGNMAKRLQATARSDLRVPARVPLQRLAIHVPVTPQPFPPHLSHPPPCLQAWRVARGLTTRPFTKQKKSETTQLRTSISAKQKQLDEIRLQLEDTRKAHHPADPDQRKAERQISDREEEMKVLEALRAESEKLKAEHRALTRVVSHLM
uniref:cGMP-dependent protein kinase interacting domain-containing protein n=1 Tax=Schistocephalus solidus TaxID=70667 RepID=A0A0X3PV82_SCHSO